MLIWPCPETGDTALYPKIAISTKENYDEPVEFWRTLLSEKPMWKFRKLIISERVKVS